jgi:hypothetical protein
MNRNVAFIRTIRPYKRRINTDTEHALARML